MSNSQPPKRSLRTQKVRELQRKAFAGVVEAYLLFCSITKSAQALNYAKCNEGDGPKYKPTEPIMFCMIEFEADVCNIVDELCGKREKDYVYSAVLSGENDLTVISEEDLKTHEKLGRAFIARKLYPVKRYFHD